MSAAPNTPDHTSRAHSTLGASIAHRWLACPGSVRLSNGIEESGSTIFAAEGSAAHELAEMCLRAGFAEAAGWIGETIVVGNHTFVVDEEMAEAVQVYVDLVQSLVQPGDILLIEHRFDLSHIHPAMFGTGDAGVYNVASKTLRVIDYKHGKGHAVEVKNNPQLAYYGLGMIAVPSLKGIQIADVELIIVQPRAPHADGPVRRWMTDPVALMDFEEDLRTGALATEQADAPLVAGEHCGFCPAAGICPALRKVAIEDAQREFVDVVPGDLTEQGIAVLLEKCGLVEDGVRAIKREAYSRAAGGAKIPGWKIVAKRAQRKWKDQGKAEAELVITHELDVDDIYDRKLKSPAQIEKLIPKSQRAGLADYYEAVSSGTTLARETDRRAEYTPAQGAADDFDPID